MNETATLNPAPLLTPASSAAPASLYQRLVLDALEKMTAGSLRLELPGGALRMIGIPGAEVDATISVRSAAFFQKCVLFGDVGFGESYVDGDWDTDSIERVIAWAILNVENSPAMSGSKVRSFALNLLKFYNRARHLLRPNDVTIARRNIAEHYDLGNDFYRLWLDETMTYSSACFTAPGQSLRDAQIAKYDALCRKLKVRAGEHLLEIGSGWGGMACHAAKQYGVRVTTVTISEEQFKFARERIVREDLADRVEVRLQDYRHIEGQYDKIVSIEMMEALGDRYLPTYLAKLNALLKPNGLVALQYITVPDCRHAELRRGIDFIQKHIFPGSLLLSVGRVNAMLQRTGDLFPHDLEDLGASYARTLHVWWKNFNAQLAGVRALGFDERFIRKWNYYLQYCEAAFAGRNISVVQAIYTRPNNRSLHTTY
ncbi:Cyclopropane-fatty-acyl-phospholipid synthase [Chthoniobacter flavus Ellin428]|uniref:Cyclopropane-fatty-acyl-phospholipid synthase n=1 Tax=Chthoniobacter flavus Ellin428 TaxID=497964 RepID=B4D8U2_9BACT|nr:cyclopropane-fatty-acyl-phospholipid synthase family protein [Chthoniobacter flavus]EDY17150.1 Cyclopropane-fatty-acyl-phospholipid synthase [Chthoniobacter flavus Ellin428]TCO90190.1 cyclopropane-fatty-acyl-phospholipid synthase [Chthoniobacter flavus]